MNYEFGCHNSSFLPIHPFSYNVVKLTAAGNSCHSFFFFLELNLTNKSSFQNIEFPLLRTLSK